MERLEEELVLAGVGWLGGLGHWPRGTAAAVGWMKKRRRIRNERGRKIYVCVCTYRSVRLYMNEIRVSLNQTL